MGEELAAGRFALLRQQAEELLHSSQQKTPELFTGNMQQLLHELHVYHTELELQHAELQQNQQKLQDAHQRYQQLYDFAPIGYCTLDEAGLIQEINLTGATLLGSERATLVQRPLGNFLHPGDQDQYHLFCHQLMTTHQPQACELRLARTDSSVVYVRLESTVLQQPDEAEAPPFYHIVLIDISQRVQAEILLRQAHAELEQRVQERTVELLRANQALRRSEERFRLVLSDSSIIMFTHDLELRYTWIYNPITPFAAHRFLGKTDADLFAPADAERLMAVKRHVLESGSGTRQEVHLMLDKQIFWYDLKIEPLRTPDGTLRGITCVATDVTAYHRIIAAQRLLSEISKQLTLALSVPTCLQLLAHLIIEELADMCSIDSLTEEGDIYTLVFLQRNGQPEGEHFHRLPHDQIDWTDQHPVLRVFYHKQPLLVREVTEEHLQTITSDTDQVASLRDLGITSYIGVPLNTRARTMGVLSLLRTGRSPCFDEHDLETTEEVARRAALALDNIYLYEADQQAWRAAEQAADRMTRLQRVTAALVEGLSFDETARVIVTQGIAALGAHMGGIVLLNDDRTQMQTVYAEGYSEPVISTWHPFDRSAASPIARAMLEGLPVWLGSAAIRADYYPQSPPDESHSHAWAILPLAMGEHTRGVLELSFAEERMFGTEDRSFMLALAQQGAHALERARLYENERQARAEAEAALQARDQMFRLISHDLRAPLTTIQGYAHLLKRRVTLLDSNESERFLRGLSNIEMATTRMSAQIQELLDVASLQAGQELSLNMKAVELVSLVVRTVEALQETTHHHQLRLHTSATQMLCMSDELRLERVLANLLTNAIKYSPRGGDVDITLEQNMRDDQLYAMLSVRDYGVGIPAADLPRLFTPFQRGSNVVGRIRGTGLGLASVRQIIEQHGGQITVESEEDQGTTFTIWLPLADE